MSFEWANFLYIAQELVGKTPAGPPSQEAKLRVANSRAYYAAFWVALIHLREIDMDPDVSDPYVLSIHSTVRNKYRDYRGNRMRTQIGVNLDRLLQSRRKADYDGRQLLIRALTKETELNMELASQVISLVKSL